jgi:hypothetical protein
MLASRRRTLWDVCPPPVCMVRETHANPSDNFVEGTYLHQQRLSDEWRFKFLCGYPGWPRIPDSQLPEPWSTRWNQFIDVDEWRDDYEDDLVGTYGADLLGYVPALFIPVESFRGSTVLCPREGAGIYYLWQGEASSISNLLPPGYRSGLHKFEGIYAGLQHFINDADWNRLRPVPVL